MQGQQHGRPSTRSASRDPGPAQRGRRGGSGHGGKQRSHSSNGRQHGNPPAAQQQHSSSTAAAADARTRCDQYVAACSGSRHDDRQRNSSCTRGQPPGPPPARQQQEQDARGPRDQRALATGGTAPCVPLLRLQRDGEVSKRGQLEAVRALGDALAASAHNAPRAEQRRLRELEARMAAAVRGGSSGDDGILECVEFFALAGHDVVLVRDVCVHLRARICDGNGG